MHAFQLEFQLCCVRRHRNDLSPSSLRSCFRSDPSHDVAYIRLATPVILVARFFFFSNTKFSQFFKF